jgi:hypothetical protein
MFDIISQREEAEEARKMDEARKLSEQVRKEEARRRREIIEQELSERIRQGGPSEWLSDEKMFPNSWILRGGAKVPLGRMLQDSAPLKNKLIELLQLENKALRWYKPSLPRRYFAIKVTERLVAKKTSTDMLAQLRFEVDTLQKQLYTLSEQEGGVPRAFREAHDEAPSDGTDIQVLQVNPSTKRAATSGSAPEVIEIL